MRYRKTIQRKLVIDTLHELGGHPTAQEIHRKIQEKYENISIATVYNNLKGLEKEGQIHVISMAGRADRYDANLTRHHHIRCLNCGEVCDVSAKKVAEVHEHIEEVPGYLVQGYEILFYGVCPACQAEEQKADRIKED